MIKYKMEFKKAQVYECIVCDKCGKEYTDDMEIQEFLHIRNTGGYSSIFGDMEDICFDICQYCLHKFLKGE